MGKVSRGNLGKPTTSVVSRDGLGIAGRDGLGITSRDGLSITSRDGLGIAIKWLSLYKDTIVPTYMTSKARSLVVNYLSLQNNTLSIKHR